MNVAMRKEMALKRSRLEYKHIENNEICELVNRVCYDPVKSFMDGFNSILNGIGLIIKSASLLFIVMSSTLISGLLS